MWDHNSYCIILPFSPHYAFHNLPQSPHHITLWHFAWETSKKSWEFRSPCFRVESKIFLLCENHHFKHTQKNAVWKSVLKQCLKIIFWIGARTLGDLYCKKNIFFLKKNVMKYIMFSITHTKHIGQVDRLEAKTYNWS